MLHVMKDCPRHYFLSYITYKDWPLLNRFNKIMLRLSEGGFPKLWYDQMEEAFRLESSIRSQMIRNIDRKPFSLTEIQAPFYFLVFGYIISLVVFLLEKFVLPPKNVEKICKFFNPGKRHLRDFKYNRIKIVRRKVKGANQGRQILE